MGTESNHSRKNIGRKLTKILAGILGFWIFSICLLEILLSTSLVTDTVNDIASEYIDGNISFGKVSASVFRKFPAVTVNLEDFIVTYPSDRFVQEKQDSRQGDLTNRGCGDVSDTLATFSRFSASINITPLLFGKISLPEICLERPRIYAHSYGPDKANWNILVLSSSETEKEESETSMPDINVGKVSLTDNSEIVFTDSQKDIFALVELKNAIYEDGLAIDSLFVAGRIASDTLAVGLDRLRLHKHHDHMDVSMEAKTLVATRAFGRLNIPIEISSTVHIPKDSILTVGVHNFKAEVAAIPFEGEADLRFLDGITEIDGRLTVSECKVDDVINKFAKNFIPEASEIQTDAIIGIDMSCKGEYVHETGKLPVFSIDFIMPRARFAHKDLGEEVMVAFDAYLANTRQGSLNINVNEIDVSTNGLDLNGYGSMQNILSADPKISVEGSLSASLDSLMRFIPDTLGLIAEGNIAAEISGTAKMSDLSIYTFSQSSLTGKLTSGNLTFKMPKDSLSVVIEDLSADLGPESRVSRRDSGKTMRLMGITGKIGKIDASYKGGLAFDGNQIVLSAKNSAEGIDTSKVGRLGGRLSAQGITLTDASGMSINMDETENGFQMRPHRDNPSTPLLTLTSKNKRITLITDVNRAILTDASLKADAAMRSIEIRRPSEGGQRRERGQRPQADLPEWMQDEDFRKQDIDIRLDQSLAKYFREWDLNGDIDIRTGILMTPYFPLRNILRGMHVSFSNDRIGIDSLKVMSGKSGIAAKGELTGLRRALTGRGGARSTLKLDMDISTDGMDANEILTAYNAGSHFNPEAAKDKMSDASNSEFLKMVINDTTSVKEEAKLIVIPGNLNADITLNGKGITWSDLTVSDLKANMLMKERCIQITNTMATSNIGSVNFEGFYSTRTKDDIKAGFNFEFKDLTAEKAIDLMPAVDTIMPLLKSFAGKLNCELAATARLDTNMNILPPTVNGVLRISGDYLTISNSEMFTSLAKKLKFDDRKTGQIKHMTVEGMIRDNVLEVFPFVLSLDRYTLALSGKQNLDMSYRYHASIIKSPLIIKVGVDVYGQDFENMKFKIGKPKYKNEKVPVFTSVIDETKINLATSIRNIFEKGVEAAIQENERQEAIAELKNEMEYVNAVDQETEELSEEEQKTLEATAETPETNNESTEKQ
ncbi:MAG: hypothetical protein IKY66_11225 [Bacteroidales bacterium]|nr:hypothetical protein [Bacteroidales bacterium]